MTSPSTCTRAPPPQHTHQTKVNRIKEEGIEKTEQEQEQEEDVEEEERRKEEEEEDEGDKNKEIQASV